MADTKPLPPDWPLLSREPEEIRKRRLDPNDALCRRPGCIVESRADWHRCQMKKVSDAG